MARIVKLPAKSFYGDYQILFDMLHNLELVALDTVPKKKKKSRKRNINGVDVFMLNAEFLIQLLETDPQFARMLALRSLVRRTHFMQIHKEIMNFHELKIKFEDH